MDDLAKVEGIKGYGACFCCLKLGHFGKYCNWETCDKRNADGEKCGKLHHPLLHGNFRNSFKVTRGNQVVNNISFREGVLLMSYVNAVSLHH